MGPTSFYFSYFMRYCPSDVDSRSRLSIPEISGFHGTWAFTVVFTKPETKSYFDSQEYSPPPKTPIQWFILMIPPHLPRANHVEFSTQVPLQQFVYIIKRREGHRLWGFLHPPSTYSLTFRSCAQHLVIKHSQ